MNLWTFIGAAMLLTVMPGPDILFVVTQSITRGRKAGIIFVAGLCTGLIVHVAAVSLGVSVVLMNSPVAFSALKFTGAAYLLYLSIRTFLGRNQNKINISETGRAVGKLYRRGILMNILNPKVILFFLAFFPQFIDSAVSNPVPQILLLGLIFMVQSFVIFSVVAILAERLSRRLMQQPRISLIMNVVEAFVYGLIGVSIAIF